MTRAHLNLATRIDDAEAIAPTLPETMPLRRAIEAAEPYPVDDLGKIIGSAAIAVAGAAKLPVELAAQSALAHASLAVQGHANVMLPYGRAQPVSLFFLSVASSGDRKSEADKMLGDALEQRERELGDSYRLDMADYDCDLEAYHAACGSAKSSSLKSPKTRDEIKAALQAVGPCPTLPRAPTFTADDPTIEGLHKALAHGQPSMAIFNDEGGQVSGGHAMNKENLLKTAAGLSKLWDGSPIRRVRAGDSSATLRGRRLSVHLMMQVGNARNWLADASLQDQGFFARFLIAEPKSLKGTRTFSQPTTSQLADIANFGAQALNAYRRELPYSDFATGDLQPRDLPFSDDARRVWKGFHDYVESKLGEDGKLSSISAQASKMAAQAGRIAGVITLFEDIDARKIELPAIDRAVRLATWYLNEGVRLHDAGLVSPDIAAAEKLLAWLQATTLAQSYGSGRRRIDLVDIYQRGPRGIRKASEARTVLAVLEAHGWAGELSKAGNERCAYWFREA